jgi:hypothetical protein
MGTPLSSSKVASTNQVHAAHRPASLAGSKGVDGTLRNLASADPLHAAGAGSYLEDCLHEVQHMDERVKRLEQVIVEVMKVAPQPMQELIRGLQALRGVAHISAVTIAVELGNISSRFKNARRLMGYCGAIPSERLQWQAQTKRKHYQGG